MRDPITQAIDVGLHDPEVMEDLSRRFRPALLAYFYRRTHDAVEAEDLAQEVFVRILKRGDVAKIQDARAYLFEIAASVFIDRGRRNHVRHLGQHSSFDADIHGSEDFASERIYLAREALERASAALRQMPERTRTVFVLRRLEGMRYGDIARRLGISVSAVEKQMVSAVTFLVRWMEKS
jgi:RNA polymerase sigma factor (sigma-70 family)